MNLFDIVALWGRKYERQTLGVTGRQKLTLHDVLEVFGSRAILQLSVRTRDGSVHTVRPDSIRKLKVSILDDGISRLHSASDDWYEVYQTAPTGDSSKVRIRACSSSGARLGEIHMVVGRRDPQYYFEQDPLLDVLGDRR